jgi:hypothetical protein
MDGARRAILREDMVCRGRCPTGLKPCRTAADESARELISSQTRREAGAQSQRSRQGAVCPTGVARQAGKQFTCTVTMANGQQSRFIVTEKDDKGNVHYQAAGTQQ